MSRVAALERASVWRAMRCVSSRRMPSVVAPAAGLIGPDGISAWNSSSARNSIHRYSGNSIMVCCSPAPLVDVQLAASPTSRILANNTSAIGRFIWNTLPRFATFYRRSAVSPRRVPLLDSEASTTMTAAIPPYGDSGRWTRRPTRPAEPQPRAGAGRRDAGGVGHQGVSKPLPSLVPPPSASA